MGAPGARRLVAVGLGANLGDAVSTVLAAAEELARGPMLESVRLSRLFQSAPLGPPQPDFVNAVLVGTSTWEPTAILRRLQGIEAAHGRQRVVRWGPRTLDLDLLFVGDTCCEGLELTLPHAGVPLRGFVLAPLCDVAPDAVHPGLGATYRELYASWRRSTASPHALVWPLGEPASGERGTGAEATQTVGPAALPSRPDVGSTHRSVASRSAHESNRMGAPGARPIPEVAA